MSRPDTLNEKILITDLEENLADDPYGTAMFVIRNVLHRALLNLAMSEREYAELGAILAFLKLRGHS